jgi:hypothetical protein
VAETKKANGDRWIALRRASLPALHVPFCKASSKAKTTSPQFTAVALHAPRFQYHAALPSRREPYLLTYYDQ